MRICLAFANLPPTLQTRSVNDDTNRTSKQAAGLRRRISHRMGHGPPARADLVGRGTCDRCRRILVLSAVPVHKGAARRDSLFPGTSIRGGGEPAAGGL